MRSFVLRYDLHEILCVYLVQQNGTSQMLSIEIEGNECKSK